MTLNDLQRAALVMFAAREAIETGSLQTMKGICYVIRNRVKAGWYDGTWFAVLEHHRESAGNEPRDIELDASNRILQMMIRDVDDIFYSQGSDPVEEAIGKCLYWNFIDRPAKQWFRENIIGNEKDHPIRAHIGMALFYE
jgi:hypothetical protein